MPAPPIPDLYRAAAVVFDLDGVLVDSEPLHFRAANRVLQRYQTAISEEEYRSYIGMGERPTWELWQERFGLKAPVGRLLEEHTEARLQEISDGIVPIDDAAVLARLLHANGVRLAIASSSTPRIIDALLCGLALAEVFLLRVSGDDAEVKRGKPAPDIYLLAARRLGVSVTQCIAVEDSGAGVLAAKRAGMTCIAVPTRWTAAHDFSGADVVVGSLRDVLPRLRR